MRNLLFLSVIFLMLNECPGQVKFQRVYGAGVSSEAQSVVPTQDSGFVIAGHMTATGLTGSNLSLMKIDKSGDLVWSKAITIGQNDLVRYVAGTNDGGFILSGYTSDNSWRIIPLIVKTNSTGDVQWVRRYSNMSTAYFFCAQPTHDGGYILACYGQSLTNGWDGLLMKTDSTGIIQWQNFYGGATTDGLDYVNELSDGSFVAAGWNYEAQRGPDSWLMKVNASGTLLWSKDYGGFGDEDIQAAIPSRSGGIIACGVTSSYGGGGMNILLFKTDSLGNVSWSKAYGGASDERGEASLLENPDGSIVVTGYCSSYGAGAEDAYFLKTDGTGNLLNFTLYGGTGDEDGRAIRRTLDQGYILVGWTSSYSVGGHRAYVVKTDSNGAASCLDNTATPVVTSIEVPAIGQTATLEGNSGFSMLETGFVESNANFWASSWCPSDTSNKPSEAGRVLFYPFNGNAHDSSGNGFNATVAGAVLAADRFGNENHAYSFNGYSSIIRCGDILDTVFSDEVAKFSVSGWANTKSFGDFATGGGFLVGKNAGGDYGPYQWSVSHINGLVLASVFSDTAQDNYVELAFPMGTNQWFHFVLTFDGSLPEMQRLQLHVNGQTSGVYVRRHLGTLGTSTTNSLQQLTIGASHNANAPQTANNFYNGTIDEISIYNRVLSNADIQALYHEGGWPTSTDTTLHAARLESVYIPNAGNVPLTSLSFSSNGSYDSGGFIDSVYWYVNGSLVGRQHDLTYPFAQGTSQVKLVVHDNLGFKDSSMTTATISKFKDFLNGPVYAGPSLLGRGVLYVIGTGDAVYRLDSAGNILYSLQVNGSIKSSSTIAFDTTVYIGSSDKNLYAFSKSGNEVWAPIAMGGALNSTPVADSITNRIYVGVSNKNIAAVDRPTGTVAWNYFADAPIASSAAITPDRKLVFASVKGTIYGFDLTNLTSPPQPAWQIPLSDSIYSSPAVDDEGYIYYCATSGRILKISMFQGEPASIVWQLQAGGAITGSPVIDGNGDLYVGCTDSKLYSINIANGTINWTYESGSSILSTPAISSIGMIYFGNHGGRVIALDSDSFMHWCYQDSASVDAPLLYDHGTLFVGTTSGRFLAFYDGADSIAYAANSADRISGRSAVPIQAPLWGTFHGDNQRTGVATHLRVVKVSDKTNLIPNEYALSQNYPNPFNPSTTIEFAVPVRSHVKIEIFNLLGQRVAELLNGEVGPGYYEKEWQAAVSSGLYLYRIEAVSLTDPGKHFVAARKMLLLK